jgi:hypothetical protein
LGGNGAASRAASFTPRLHQFLQNHDQIGNRVRGDRLERLGSEGTDAALAITCWHP